MNTAVRIGICIVLVLFAMHAININIALNAAIDELNKCRVQLPIPNITPHFYTPTVFPPIQILDNG